MIVLSVLSALESFHHVQIAGTPSGPPPCFKCFEVDGNTASTKDGSACAMFLPINSTTSAALFSKDSSATMLYILKTNSKNSLATFDATFVFCTHRSKDVQTLPKRINNGESHIIMFLLSPLLLLNTLNTRLIRIQCFETNRAHTSAERRFHIVATSLHLYCECMYCSSDLLVTYYLAE